MAQNESPLGPDDLVELDKAIGLVTQAQRECVRAANCGYDVTAHNMIAEALRARLEAIRHHYGPQRRE